MQRTAALYVAGAWIALQVVEVFAGAGLPPGTMRQLLVALSAAVALRGATFGEADAGLVDYWRKWGWSDYCEPVGEDDFRCD